MRHLILTLAALCCLAAALDRPTLAGEPGYGPPPLGPVRSRIANLDETHWGRDARRRAAREPWHGPYYRYGWERPVALVVPPTVERQTDYGWGVGATRVTRINHQFQRPYPADYYAYPGPPLMPTPLMSTPPWPSDTRQFGVYYVRGPW